MRSWTIRFGGAATIRCPAGETVLAAATAAGSRAIPVGCRGGGCGVCRVRVVSGRYDAGQMSAAEVPDDDRREGVVLACRLYPRSDLEVLPLGRRLAARKEPHEHHPRYPRPRPEHR